MTDQNAKKEKTSSGCLGKMREMMRDMMSQKGGSCCSWSETMTRMMPECCSVQTQKENPVEEQDHSAPK